MRLRHRKWASRVVSENTEIAKDLTNFNPDEIKLFNNLEIGFGRGGFLIALSALNPNKTYLGVELNKTAFAIATKKASEIKEDCHNFMLLNSPIERILPLFNDEQLDNIYINFPDPWPKKKQNKKRLSYPAFHKEYYRILKKDGNLYFRTDNITLFEDSVEYFNITNLFDIEIIDPFLSETVDYLPKTEYETKFREKGVNIHLIIAKKK